MCIPPIDHDPVYYFTKLKLLANENNIKELSIGMSNDYKLAIKYNSNMIRIGSLIFGSRN